MNRQSTPWPRTPAHPGRGGSARISSRTPARRRRCTRSTPCSWPARRPAGPMPWRTRVRRPWGSCTARLLSTLCAIDVLHLDLATVRYSLLSLRGTSQGALARGRPGARAYTTPCQDAPSWRTPWNPPHWSGKRTPNTSQTIPKTCQNDSSHPEHFAEHLVIRRQWGPQCVSAGIARGQVYASVSRSSSSSSSSPRRMPLRRIPTCILG